MIGYLDGVVVPRTPAELDAHVWIDSGPARNGTICVLRRLVVDVDRFRAEADERQDAIIGRHRGDGSPLSGGAPMDQVDLTAKTPDGQYVVPAHAHARAAHPSFTGSNLMLRGSYSFDNGPRERGTLFRCFQRDLDTFVRTQRTARRGRRPDGLRATDCYRQLLDPAGVRARSAAGELPVQLIGVPATASG